MEELNKLFCTYEQSKELEKLGFNGNCLANYMEMESHIDEEARCLRRCKCLIETNTIENYFTAIWIEDEDVKAMYDDGTWEYPDQHSRVELCGDYLKAPLKAQAFQFFRDKFKISYEPWIVGHKQHFFDLCSIENEFKSEEIYSVKCESPYSNQEAAESAAIDKLIEICKKK